MRRKVSSDDAHVDDNKSDLDTSSRSVYLLGWRFEQNIPISVQLVNWLAEVVAEGLL